MLKNFSKIRTLDARAVQIWQILISLAANRQTTTYGILSKKLGFGGAGVMGKFLDPIMRFCKTNDLPPLTVLVVGKYAGVPGEGLVTVDETDRDMKREEVYEFDWFDIYPPSTEDFAKIMA